MLRRLKLALNRYAFHWSYPEILADELGLFSDNGLEVEWNDATPSSVAYKTKMYTDLLTERKTDIYHAGEWACINRVLKAPGTEMIAKSEPGEGTLNRSFALYVRGDSAVRTPRDLSGRTVAIEEGTGAQFTAMSDLEAHMGRDLIRLVQVGEPHRRLLSVLNGEVEAASLVGPWSDIGGALGLRKVLQTIRSNPTTIVVRKGTEEDLLRCFFLSANAAIAAMNTDPERYKESYFRRVEAILDEMALDVPREDLKRAVSVPRWNPWVAYSWEEFQKTLQWMAERGLAPSGEARRDAVGGYPSGVFPQL